MRFFSIVSLVFCFSVLFYVPNASSGEGCCGGGNKTKETVVKPTAGEKDTNWNCGMKNDDGSLVCPVYSNGEKVKLDGKCGNCGMKLKETAVVRKKAEPAPVAAPTETIEPTPAPAPPIEDYRAYLDEDEPAPAPAPVDEKKDCCGGGTKPDVVVETEPAPAPAPAPAPIDEKKDCCGGGTKPDVVAETEPAPAPIGERKGCCGEDNDLEEAVRFVFPAPSAKMKKRPGLTNGYYESGRPDEDEFVIKKANQRYAKFLRYYNIKMGDFRNIRKALWIAAQKKYSRSKNKQLAYYRNQDRKLRAFARSMRNKFRSSTKMGQSHRFSNRSISNRSNKSTGQSGGCQHQGCRNPLHHVERFFRKVTGQRAI